MSTSAYKLIFSLILLLIAAASATDHIVGANRGWNPGINYTLWANNHTFFVGDLISFRYQKMQYNVFEVNQTGYDNCTTEGAVGNWTSGKDFIPLDEPKRYYFICGNGGCFSGMKVSVLVHPLPPPPSSADHLPANFAAPLLLRRESPAIAMVWMVVMVLVSICVETGWI